MEMDDLEMDDIFSIDDDSSEDTEDIIEDIVIDSDDSECDDDGFLDDLNISKHKQMGKHTLKWDKYFKGSRDEDREVLTETSFYFSDNFEMDTEVSRGSDSYNFENASKYSLLKEKVYEIITAETEIDVTKPRRMPSKINFNDYFFKVWVKLKNEYTTCEIFSEVAPYFSDRLFNVYKLLDKNWKDMIYKELSDYVGEKKLDKELIPKNIKVGIEIEFKWYDEINNTNIFITGVVEEVDNASRTYIVDSFVKKYPIRFDMITKIIAFHRYKYNLNKIKDLDFL